MRDVQGVRIDNFKDPSVDCDPCVQLPLSNDEVNSKGNGGKSVQQHVDPSSEGVQQHNNDKIIDEEIGVEGVQK